MPWYRGQPNMPNRKKKKKTDILWEHSHSLFWKGEKVTGNRKITL